MIVKGLKRHKMKICAIICEYNPFHNGHLYQLREAKRLSGADAVLCIMSGNFVQRGEAAIMDKYMRAKHAVQAGADIVIELPTVFATSNAELFAQGAVHILSSIPDVSSLCFGCENADKNAFITAAKQLNNEPKNISLKIKENIAIGMSYAKARAIAWENHINCTLLSSPNNILGIEYTKALLATKSHIEILPIARIGAGYHDASLTENYSSATAIRTAIENTTEIENQTPDFVKKDLPKVLNKSLEIIEKYALICRSKEEIASVCDCTEGLENALKKAAKSDAPLIESLTSSRYTASRIRRIALQNLLQIDENFIRQCLSASLYFRILAIKKERLDILSALSQAKFPTILRAHDEDHLDGIGKKCYEKDIFAEEIYSLLYPVTKKKHILI